MTKYARVENNQVIEYRDFADGEIPAHKAIIWLPVEDIPPSYNPFYQTLSGPTIDIQPDKVVWQYTLTDRPTQQIHNLVSEERDRRIAAGISVTVSNTTFTVQTRDEVDFRNVNGLVSKGILLVSTGDVITTVPFRDLDNVEHELTATDLISMGEQVAANVTKIYQYAWYLKSLDPVPETYNSDQWWTWVDTPPIV